MLDMLSLLPDAAETPFDSRHRMVIAASQRAKYLMQGGRPALQSKFRKETTVALDEVMHGHIEFLTGKDARQAMKEAKRMKEAEAARVQTPPEAVVEDAREIKKELSVYVDDSPKPAAPAEPDAE